MTGPRFDEARAFGHRCHAQGCERAVPPKLLMCRRHWFMVPKGLRDRVWRTYRPGQERDKLASKEYLEAARLAVAAVAAKETGDAARAPVAPALRAGGKGS